MANESLTPPQYPFPRGAPFCPSHLSAKCPLRVYDGTLRCRTQQPPGLSTKSSSASGVSPTSSPGLMGRMSLFLSPPVSLTHSIFFSRNAHYPPHSHSGLTTHLIRRGSLTITYPEDVNPTKETFSVGARIDVPAGKVHEVWMGDQGE